MSTLLNMDPWNFLDDILGTGNRVIRSMRQRAAGRFPPVNIYLDDTAVLLDVELPGKTAQDVDLSVEPQALVIASKKVEGEEAPAWSRRLELPFRIDAEKANAKFTNGILRIELPKADAPGSKKIVIG